MKFLLLLVALALPLGAQAFDLLIRNGQIVDGTGSRTIDVAGVTVAPGFIDMLGQSEASILVNPHLASKIFQGITTEVTGEGSSAAPLTDALRKSDRAGYEHYKIDPARNTFREFFARLDEQGIGINLASYVGAAQVRRAVIGDGDRAPTRAELQRMKALVRDAVRDGAVGVSTSLQYAPAPFASTEELIALAAEGARMGGIYATHMRSEGDAIIRALDEAIRIGREAQVPVEIWHLKAAGRQNWGRIPEIVAHIDAARRAGIEIGADTDAKLIERLKDPALRARIRKEMQTPGVTWDNESSEIPGPEAILLCVVQNPKLLPLQAKTIAEIAKLWNKDPIDTTFDVLIEDNAATEVAVFGMSEADVRLAPQQPWTNICNDSQGAAPDGLIGLEHPHSCFAVSQWRAPLTCATSTWRAASLSSSYPLPASRCSSTRAGPFITGRDVVSPYDLDHMGDVPLLASKFPVKLVVTAAGKWLAKPLPGAGEPNPLCANTPEATNLPFSQPCRAAASAPRPNVRLALSAPTAQSFCHAR